MVASTARRRTPYSYRADPSVPDFADDRPVIVFDGHCAMCTGWARLVLRHDRRARFRLLPAQSALGRALYLHYGLDPDQYETNILIEQGVARFRSAAAIGIARGLGPPWSLAGMLGLVPTALLDPLYDLVARNRLRILGRRAVCYLTEPGMEDRFLP
jgi:predicted DCC family thiol-disulfide oxidoreductase YuxK